MADLTSDFLRVVLAVLVGHGDTFLVGRFHRYLKSELKLQENSINYAKLVITFLGT